MPYVFCGFLPYVLSRLTCIVPCVLSCLIGPCSTCSCVSRASFSTCFLVSRVSRFTCSRPSLVLCLVLFVHFYFACFVLYVPSSLTCFVSCMLLCLMCLMLYLLLYLTCSCAECITSYICQYYLFCSCFLILHANFPYLFTTAQFFWEIYYSQNKDIMLIAF